MSRIRLLPLLFGVSAGLTAVILGPLLDGGHLLYRDAVSTPRPQPTAAALGLGELPARAVPQDWLLAFAAPVLDGGILTIALTFAALTLAGVGYGRAAARLVPGAGRSGALAATLVAIWNPWVAERLLQGHWSLLAGYAALGWLVVTAVELRDRPTAVGWLQLAALCAAAGLTPTGSVLAGVTIAAALLIPALVTGLRWRVLGMGVVCWAVGALPWLTATVVGGASTATGAAGVAAFGLRAEPWSGRLGTALGLGGIWNAEAVPASRTIGWAAVATACLLLVVVFGAVRLWRQRGGLDPVVGTLAVLGLAAVAFVLAASTAPGGTALAWLVTEVPGGGLLRDTTKYLALGLPIMTLAAGAAVAALRTWIPAGAAVGVVAILVVAPLPDLAWGVGGKLHTIDYPADYAAVAELISADAGDVAVWPDGTFRHYDFAGTPSLNPLPRMLAAPVITSGELVVDGTVVDPSLPRAVEVAATLADGGDAGRLADLGVGWVVIEGDSDTPAGLASATPVFVGETLRVYRVDDPVIMPGPSAAAVAAAETAHLAWLAILLAGAATVPLARTPLRNRRP